MTDPAAPAPDRPAPISLWVLLGLREGNDSAASGRLRAAQLRAGREMALFLLAANLIGAALTATMFGAAVPMPLLIGWLTLTAVVAVVVAIRRLRIDAEATADASVRALRDTALEGVALAAVWSVPITLFAETGSIAGFGFWMVASVLMTAAAFAMAPLALATLIFLGTVGAAGAIKVSLAGAYAAGGATLLFAALLMAGCVARARMLVALRAAEIGEADRDATIGLLLRDFEGPASGWLWDIDAGRRIVDPRPEFARALGLEAPAMKGMPLLQALAGAGWETGAFAPGLRGLADRLAKRDAFGGHLIRLSIGGTSRWWTIAATPRTDEAGKFLGFRGVASDVTDRHTAADQSDRLAHFDELTSLANRQSILEAIGATLRDSDRWGSRTTLLMIDLDRFKTVNDTLGHPVGDALLVQVAARLTGLARDGMRIGRLGGDEFAIVVGDAFDAAGVAELADSILAAMAEPFEIEGETIHIGASIGAATAPRDGATAELLLRSADLALHRAKAAGGGVLRLYEPRLHVVAEERRTLEIALRGALENGEFQLHYQPVVESATGGLVAFEALLRWHSPEHGAIATPKFIAIAEEARLIAPIGEWVMRTACAEASTWAGDVRVSVNVSATQLSQPAFVAVVASALSRSGLAPDRLELEVTENVFANAEAIETLSRIAALGVRIGLDDFGAGHSSLHLLGRMDFASIKMNRGFLQTAATGNAAAIAIVRAVVALANGLGIPTTAKGIENKAELASVRDLGCTNVQGFYFSSAIPAKEALAVVQRYHSDARAA